MASPVFGNATSVSATAASSISVSHTATAGSNTFVFVGGGSSAEAPALTSTCTYGGTSMTEQWDFIAQTFYHNSGHYLVNPATGAQTVTLTLANADDELVLGVMSFTDVNQSTPIGTHATANGSGTTATVNVSSASDELVVDNVYIGNPTATVGAGQTERWSQAVSSATVGKGSTEVGAATTTMSYTTSPSDSWTIGAVPIKGAAAADVLMPQILLAA